MVDGLFGSVYSLFLKNTLFYERTGCRNRFDSKTSYFEFTRTGGNKKDLYFATKKKLKTNLVKRLILDKKKISSIIKSIKSIKNFKDPVNKVLEKWQRPNGLKISKVTTPIGVISVIYESRPNVTCDVAALCFKSGNPVILKGGSEAYYSNKILSNLFRKALKKNKINQNYVQFINHKKSIQ